MKEIVLHCTKCYEDTDTKVDLEQIEIKKFRCPDCKAEYDIVTETESEML